MYCMSRTLDVLKLSVWLNFRVSCRVQRGAWEAGDMQSRWGGGLDGSGKHVGAIQMEDWAGAEPHRKHVIHVRDARRVDTQRLVERTRVLPSPKGGMLRGKQACQETGGRGGGSLSDAQHGPDW